ncbi:hypothetical protein [Fibrobacter sp. UWB5]|uniref:hypothetical protein n=1 Tax=Fibrobacter sp. UWB5 TaxID=1964360 RepID=UPI000B5234A7|nr:hypothetical protein [Fibrobacter sp. UWB5]OWV13965.1 hypothetical protein B7989_00385 [Fibrobacter sp. UWB5]
MGWLGKFNLFVFLFTAVSAVHAFAQPAEVDGPILQDYCPRCNDSKPPDYMPYGFTAEIAYAGPTVLSVQLGGRFSSIKGKALVGIPILSADIDFDEWSEGWKISDEGILGFFLCIGAFGGNGHDFRIWLDYLLFGNTYYPLTEDASIGLFETHHIVDYLIYDTSLGKPWEFGFSEAAGVKFIYSKSRTGDVYYLDVGANVRLTNKAFRFGAFVQFGFTGTYT